MTSPYITSLRPVNPDDARPDQKIVLDHARKQVGFIPNMYANMVNVPAVLDTYETVNRLMFDVQHRDARLGPKEWVLGLSVGSARKAYPFSSLARRVGKDGILEDRLGGQLVRIRYDAQHRTARAEDGTGQPLPSVLAFWFAWVAFHPKTELLT